MTLSTITLLALGVGITYAIGWLAMAYGEYGFNMKGVNDELENKLNKILFYVSPIYVPLYILKWTAFQINSISTTVTTYIVATISFPYRKQIEKDVKKMLGNKIESETKHLKEMMDAFGVDPEELKQLIDTVSNSDNEKENNIH